MKNKITCSNLEYLQEAQEKLSQQKLIPKYKKNSSDQLVANSDDEIANYLTLCKATGTISNELQNLFLNQINRLKTGSSTQTLNAALAFLHGQNPKDEIETMMLSQMFMLHELTMTCGHQIAKCDDMDFNDRYVGRISRLTKAFRGNLDSLNKHRGKGQQKVTVEHVHVHNGGQAVVGNFETGGGGNVKK